MLMSAGLNCTSCASEQENQPVCERNGCHSPNCSGIFVVDRPFLLGLSSVKASKMKASKMKASKMQAADSYRAGVAL